MFLESCIAQVPGCIIVSAKVKKCVSIRKIELKVNDSTILLEAGGSSKQPLVSKYSAYDVRTEPCLIVFNLALN